MIFLDHLETKYREKLEGAKPSQSSRRSPEKKALVTAVETRLRALIGIGVDIKSCSYSAFVDDSDKK